MLYVTGGLAYGEFQRLSLMDRGTNRWTSANGLSCSAGWTVGAGVEAALGSNWSVKFEYLYMDLGNVGGSYRDEHHQLHHVRGTTTTTTLAYVFNTKFTDNIVRVGLNYKFGGPDPVVARY